MIINDLIATYTVEHRDKLYFRVEIYRVDTGTPIQGSSIFSEVYLLRIPNGVWVKQPGKLDSSFRQAWLYLEDFAMVRGASLQEVTQAVNSEILRYGDDYLAKFDLTMRRQK
ncbi:MAG: hypothetical protein WC869_12755 [Phycisphaerae bacterium]|jgi:hypothetical protein